MILLQPVYMVNEQSRKSRPKMRKIFFRLSHHGNRFIACLPSDVEHDGRRRIIPRDRTTAAAHQQRRDIDSDQLRIYRYDTLREP